MAEETKKSFENISSEEQLKKDKAKAKSKKSVTEASDAKELKAIEKGEFKFINSKTELEYLAKFMENARMPVALQMSKADKQKAETAAANWYAKAQKTLNAS